MSNVTTTVTNYVVNGQMMTNDILVGSSKFKKFKSPSTIKIRGHA